MPARCRRPTIGGETPPTCFWVGAEVARESPSSVRCHFCMGVSGGQCPFANHCVDNFSGFLVAANDVIGGVNSQQLCITHAIARYVEWCNCATALTSDVVVVATLPIIGQALMVSVVPTVSWWTVRVHAIIVDVLHESVTTRCDVAFLRSAAAGAAGRKEDAEKKGRDGRQGSVCLHVGVASAEFIVVWLSG